MATEWKVMGNKAATKITATCPVCHTGATLHGEPGKVIRKRFKHNGCKGLVESIPTAIRDEYWDRAVVSQY
jgi:hypothetical protein